MRTSSSISTVSGLCAPRNWARAAVAFGAIALPNHLAIAQGGPDRPELFSDVAAGQEVRMSDVPTAVRQRNVLLNLDLLSDDRNPRGRADGLTLSLFEDTVVSGAIDRVVSAYRGGSIVVMNLDQDPNGHAYLSIINDSITATIRLHDRLYQVHSVGDGGQHTVSEVDESQQPPCDTPDAVHGAAKGLAGAPLPATSGEIIDMLVVFTDDARTSYGIDGIISLVNLAIFETNQGYANSDANIRVNLVLARMVDFDETTAPSLATWVGQLRNVDGVIDEVHQWRDACGADAVCMITDSGAGYCGRAYSVLTTVSAAGAADAFNVTASSCATGYYSFGHELGHSLGCQHDRASTSGAAVFPYCYGIHTPSQTFRTIMAYSPGTRINFWSNPSKLAPNGEVLGAAGSEENWMVLNNVVGTASGWRTSRNNGQSIVTTFNSNNGFAGNMFNVHAKETVEITAMQINTSAATSTRVAARVWYRRGSYFNASSTSASWCLLGTGSGIAAGKDRPTMLNFRSTATFRSEQTYGVYVELLNYSLSNQLRYTDGGPSVYENNQIRVTTGSGKGVGFTSATFLNREWNGRIFYRGGTGTGSLTTTFAGGNGFAGNMFSVTPSKTLTIDSFDVHVDGTGPVTVDVWRRNGSYVGFESNASGWTFLGSEFKAATAGLGMPTRIAIDSNGSLNAGTMYSFYVVLTSYSSGQSLRYTNGSGSYSNSDLTIDTGIGRGDGSFSGSIFADRTWNGTVHYTLAGSISKFGVGCLGSNGIPSHSASGSPVLGGTINYSLTSGPSNGAAFLVLGNSKTNWSGLPLPFDLAPIGAPGCIMYCNHSRVIGPIGTSATGSASFPVGIAAQCGLIGVHLYTQFLMIDPGANALGLTSSNAVDALLGN